MPNTPNVYTDLVANVTFTPTSGTAKGSYTDYKLILIEPTYGTKKRKDVLVSLPYMNGELDFSEQYNNTSFYECSEFTYKWVRQFAPSAAGATAMKTTHTNFESFCWGFHGSILDDYGLGMSSARCVEFKATPFPGDNTLTIEAKFRGVR